MWRNERSSCRGLLHSTPQRKLYSGQRRAPAALLGDHSSGSIWFYPASLKWPTVCKGSGGGFFAVYGLLFSGLTLFSSVGCQNKSMNSLGRTISRFNLTYCTSNNRLKHSVQNFSNQNRYILQFILHTFWNDSLISEVQVNVSRLMSGFREI